MSTKEFLQAAKIPYKRLLGRLKPYKTRFAAGVVFGVVAGLFNAVMLFVFKFVFGLVLTSGSPQEAKLWTEALNFVAQPETEFRVEQIEIALSAAEATETERFTDALNTAANSNLTTEDVRKARERKEETSETGSANGKSDKYIDKLISKIPPIELKDNIWAVIGVCSLIPLMILIRGMLGYLHQYCMMWVGNRVLYDLRSELFGKLVNQSLSFFNKQKTGELIQTVFNQTRMAQTAGTNLASDLIKHPISIVAIVAFLLAVDPWFTFAALVLFPLCLIPVVAVSNKVRKAGGREEEEAGMLMVTMQESFAGIRVVKAHAREDYESEKFNAASRRMLAFIMRWRKAMEIVGPFVEAFASIGIAAGLVYAWKFNISTDEFLILYLALIGMYPHAKALSKIQIQLQKCLVATTKVLPSSTNHPELQTPKMQWRLQSRRGASSFAMSTSATIRRPLH